MPRVLQNTRRQHTRTGSDLEHRLDGLDVRLGDDGVGDRGVLEYVLADLGVELEDGRLAGGPLVGRRGARAVALRALGLRHGCGRSGGSWRGVEGLGGEIAGAILGALQKFDFLEVGEGQKWGVRAVRMIR